MNEKKATKCEISHQGCPRGEVPLLLFCWSAVAATKVLALSDQAHLIPEGGFLSVCLCVQIASPLRPARLILRNNRSAGGGGCQLGGESGRSTLFQPMGGGKK